MIAYEEYATAEDIIEQLLDMAEVVDRTLHRLFGTACELSTEQSLDNIIHADHMGRTIGQEEISALSA